MASFTPGPWEVSTLDGRTIGPVGYTHTDPEVRRFAIPQMKAVAVVKERLGCTEANARLIAAAPALLGACEAALAVMHAYVPPDLWDGHCGRAMVLLRDALAAAKTPDS